MKNAILLSLTALLFLLLVSPAFAQADPWQRQVNYQLQQASIAFHDFALTASHDPVTDTLNNKQVQTVTYVLRAGLPYVFLGVCDEDCSRLRLALYDANGNLIDVDGGSPTPTLIVHIYATDYFLLRVMMERCSHNPCRYGVGAYTQQ